MLIKIIFYLVLSVSGLILFKVGGCVNHIQLDLNKIDMSISLTSLIGIMCYGCSFLLWLNIIKDNDLSYIFPIANGLVTIATVLGGILLLHEKVQGIQWIGILSIIVGVFIINTAR